MTSVPRSPSVPQPFPGNGVDTRSPVPLPIRERGTGNGSGGIADQRCSPPCIGCGEPTPGNPSICKACADERARAGQLKAVFRAAALEDRMTPKEDKR